MIQHQERLDVDTRGRGFVEITGRVRTVLTASGVITGVAHLFIQHTSASLLVQENADPAAQFDMEQWLTRVAPEDDPHYTHTLEGADDMPSHLRSILTSTSESVPVAGGKLLLGTWQGIYVCEHRTKPHMRRVVVHILGEPG